MNKRNALKLLKSGRYQEWNQYRIEHPDWKPDFKNANLREVDFANNFFDMQEADLRGAYLPSKHFLPAISPVSDKSRISTWLETVESDAIVSLFDSAVYDLSTKFLDSSDAVHLKNLGAEFVDDFDFRNEKVPTLPKVFISYAWKDKEPVRAIAKWLHINGLIIKIDVHSFVAGENIRAETLRVMKECDVILIFYSNNSKDRPWVIYERELAYDLEMDAKGKGVTPPRVIYVLLDETPLFDPISKNRIAVKAKGEKFVDVCRQIYDQILMIPTSMDVDLKKWDKITL